MKMNNSMQSVQTLLALLCLWEEELGRRRERVAGHQHQLLELQQLLDVLFNVRIRHYHLLQNRLRTETNSCGRTDEANNQRGKGSERENVCREESRIMNYSTDMLQGSLLVLQSSCWSGSGFDWQSVPGR